MNCSCLVLFSILTILTVPLNQYRRQGFIYNMKKRTSILTIISILFKLLSVLLCFSVNLYHSIINLKWYFSLGILVIYYIFLIFPIVQAIYLYNALIYLLANNSFFPSLHYLLRTIIVIIFLLVVPIIIIITCYFITSIYIFYVLSIFTGYQFYYSIKRKVYSFGRMYLYDINITFIMTVCSLWIPSVNITPISLK